MSFFVFGLAEIQQNISTLLLCWSANSQTVHLMRGGMDSPVSLPSLSLLKPPFPPLLLTGITCTAFQYSWTQFCLSYFVFLVLQENKTVIWSQRVLTFKIERLPSFRATQAWPHPSRLTADRVFRKALFLWSHWNKSHLVLIILERDFRVSKRRLHMGQTATTVRRKSAS